MTTAWTAVTLADVVELQRGHDLPASERQPGDVPVVGSAGVSGYHSTPRYSAPGVVIGRSGASIGNATYVDQPYWPLNTGLFVRDFRGNDPRWIYRLLDWIDFAAYNSGSAQPSLNRNFLRGIAVALPPIAEQRAIAEVLGALDDKIAANDHTIRSIEELSVQLLAAAPATCLVRDVARPATKQLKPDQFEDVVAHFSLPAFDASRRPAEDQADAIKSNKQLIEAPAVLVSKLNPRIPRVWDIPQMPDRMALASTEFVVLSPVDVSTSELAAAVSQPAVTTRLAESVSGTSGSHQRIKPAAVFDAQIPDPQTLSDRARAALTAAGLLAHRRRQENKQLAELRDTLLPALMSGRLTVNAATDAVDEALPTR